jgi:predicted transcriptional regulator
MPRPRSQVLTEAEQRIMRVLWAKGEASVRDVTEALSRQRTVAYNTVLTLLRILTDKGYVAPRKEGRAFIYAPLVSRADARTQALKQLLTQFFEGSPSALAQHLIKEEDLDLEEIEALKREIDKDDPDQESSEAGR